MVETMVAWGVTHVFGMVGHSNLGFADAMRRQEEAGNLTFVGIRHEGAASFAASAYGKLTGRPAACFGIAGPGSTNLLTGLYDAKVDRAPVLAISGQVPSKVLGRGAFQDVDLTAAFADVASYSKTVLPESDHAELMTLALKHAIVERDVAHLVLPDEVQVLPAPDERPAVGPRRPGRRRPRSRRRRRRSTTRSRCSAGARRPVIVVGHGARFEMAPVLALAEALDAPVLTTFKAKGQVSDRHPLGRRRARPQRHAGRQLAHERVRPAARVRRVVLEPHRHRAVQADRAGRLRPDGARALPSGDRARARPRRRDRARCSRDRLTPNPDRVDQRAEIAERWAIWRAEKARRLADDRMMGVSSAAVFDCDDPPRPRRTRSSRVDVGNHAYSFGRYFESGERQSVLMSGYLGSIGFGFPAAMGAWAADPDRPIVAVTGDGGFGQYLAELTTAVKYDMNITHVLLNNSSLGKISKEQRAGQFDVWQTGLHNPELRRVRAALRRARCAGDRSRRARRGAGGRARARRPRAGRDRDRPGAGVSPTRRRRVLLAVPQVLLFGGMLVMLVVHPNAFTSGLQSTRALVVNAVLLAGWLLLSLVVVPRLIKNEWWDAAILTAVAVAAIVVLVVPTLRDTKVVEDVPRCDCGAHRAVHNSHDRGRRTPDHGTPGDDGSTRTGQGLDRRAPRHRTRRHRHRLDLPARRRLRRGRARGHRHRTRSRLPRLRRARRRPRIARRRDRARRPPRQPGHAVLRGPGRDRRRHRVDGARVVSRLRRPRRGRESDRGREPCVAHSARSNASATSGNSNADSNPAVTNRPRCRA